MRFTEERMKKWGEYVTKIRGWILERAIKEDKTIAE